MSRFTGTASPRPLRVLSLDGGGVRGLSSLIILKRLMHRLDPHAKEGDYPKPCDCFDLIVGTSTGGLIAIMLGRLEMSVEECIEEYKNLAKKIFRPRKRRYLGGSTLWKWLGVSMFNAEYLEDAIKHILNTATPPLNEDAKLMDENSKCKIFVCTTMYGNTEAELLRSYVSEKEDPIKCTIVQAARATSAAPTFFDRIEIDGTRFFDGGLRNNNPIKAVRTELREEFPDRPGGCIVSIGTGVHETQKMGKSLVAVAKSCAKIATNVENAHEEFKEYECGTQGPFQGKYFRFNVDRGLQDVKLHEWKRMQAVKEHTLHYLKRDKHEVEKCIECLVHCDEAEEVEEVVEVEKVEEVEEIETSIEAKPRKSIRKRSVARLKRAWVKVSKTQNSAP